MRKSLFASSLASALALTAAPAFADEASVEAPAFSSFDRAGQGDHAGVDLSFVFVGDQETNTSLGTVSRLDLHGARTFRSGFGIYGSLALSKGFFDEGGDPTAEMVNEQFALSNVELGGLYHRALSEGWDLTAHLGVVLPTADDDLGMITNILGSSARLNDIVLMLPDVTFARVGVTPTYRNGNFFVRADLGLDVGYDTSEQVGADPIGHANIGLGYVDGRFAASAEVVTLIDIPDGTLAHSGQLSAEYRAGKVTPHLAVSKVLDDSMGVDAATIIAGVKSAF